MHCNLDPKEGFSLSEKVLYTGDQIQNNAGNVTDVQPLQTVLVSMLSMSYEMN